MKLFRVIDTDEDKAILEGTEAECSKWAERHNLKVVGNGGDPCYVVREMTNWERDDYQFPRLLAEILAVSHDGLDYDALCESMDLVPGEIHELFERADAAWERVKEETCR